MIHTRTLLRVAFETSTLNTSCIKVQGNTQEWSRRDNKMGLIT
jgi:hypothetical protein